jgi:hypothetical protein
MAMLAMTPHRASELENRDIAFSMRWLAITNKEKYSWELGVLEPVPNFALMAKERECRLAGLGVDNSPAL